MSKALREVTSPAVPPARPSIQDMFNEADRLSREIAGRAYRIFINRGSGPGAAMDDWLQAESELLTPLPVEVIQSRDTIRLRAKAPGFTVKDIRIAVEPLRCVIAGRMKSDQQQSNVDRRSSKATERRICRIVQLPEEVRPDAAVFDVRSGVIELTLLRASCRVSSSKDAA